MSKSNYERSKSAMATLSAIRSGVSYEAFKAKAEELVLDLVSAADGMVWLSSFLETPLWLAAHRLEKRGLLKPAGANTWSGACAK